MFKAILYKEWIKTHKLIILLFIVTLSLIGYTYVSTAHLFRNHGAVQAWITVVEDHISIIADYWGWFLILISFMISVFQFSSEMVNKRFKLTLHLPLNENIILIYILSYGVIFSLALDSIALLGISSILSIYYPIEMIETVYQQLFPFLLGGLCTYFFTAAIILEPIWKRRVVIFFISFSTLSAYTINITPGAYAPMIIYLFIGIIIAMIFTFYSASRFKDGAQC